MADREVAKPRRRDTQRSVAALGQNTAGTREKILSAGLAVFSRDGYEGASLIEIARIAGVGQPLIHYHFGSKEKLWREVVDHIWSDIAKDFQAVAATTVDLEPVDAIKVLCRAFAQFCSAYPDHPGLILSEMRSPGPRFDWLMASYIGPIHHYLDRILELAAAKGQIKPIPPAHLTTTILISIAHFFSARPLLLAVYGLDPRTPEAAAAHANYIVELVFEGIRIRP